MFDTLAFCRHHPKSMLKLNNNAYKKNDIALKKSAMAFSYFKDPKGPSNQALKDFYGLDKFH